MSAPRAYRWAALHGLPRLLLLRAARGGDLGAQIAMDPQLRRDPFEAYDRLRARGPVVAGRLASATASHDVARDVLRSDAFAVGGEVQASGLGRLARRLFASARDERALSPVDPPSMLAVDPPDHTRYRRLVSKVFTARAVAALEPAVQAVTDRLLDDLLARGPGPLDLVAQVAGRLPVAVIADILGVPAPMRDQLLAWGNGAAMTLDPGLTYRQFARADRDLRAMQAWFVEHVAALRRTPGDDLLSRLVTLDDDGDQLTDVELRATALLLLGAGFETTVNLIGNAVVSLLAHPDQLATLRAGPEGWPNAVEEVLRHDSPVQVTARTAIADAAPGGVPVPAGRIMVVMLGGANRDPAVFADPHRFDVSRGNARDHLGFSAGIHYCLGASLARLEAAVALRSLFERCPGLALAGEPVRRPLRVLRGYEHLPVRVG